MNSISRRDLIKTGTMVVAAGVVGPVAHAKAMLAADSRMLPIKLGVASYSLRKFDRAQLIEDLKRLKTPYVNVKDFHLPMSPEEEVRKGCEEFAIAGIKLTAAGTIYFNKDDDDDMRRKFEYCKLAGVPVMVAAPALHTLPRLEKFAKAYDIRVAIHNHGPEDKVFPSPLDVLRAVQTMDARLGLCIDIGHTARAGVDPVDAILKSGPRLYDIHIKDLSDFHNVQSQVDVGDGKLPIALIFRALQQVGYKGYVDLEYEINENDPMPGMVKSFAYMRGVIAGMDLNS